MKKTIIWAAILILLFTSAGCKKAPDGNYYSDGWEAGYGEKELTVDIDSIGKYYVAGYKNNNKAIGLLDVPKAKAMWLCAEAESLLILSVDCVALAQGDTEIIKNRISDITKATGCNMLVCSTHTHAGVDTLGLWGKVAVNGKDADYMESLYSSCEEAARSAYANRKSGKLFYSTTDKGIETLQEDSRNPQNYDRFLHQFHFIPNDGSKGVRLINYAAHAEALRGDNRKISADYPAYISEEIKEKTGDNTLFVQGAIGGLIMTKRLKDENGEEIPVEENCKDTGKLIAAAALSVEEEEELVPHLLYQAENVMLPLDNDVFVAMKSLGILNTKVKHTGDGRHGLSIETHVCRVSVGNIEVLTIPGEIFPEAIYKSEDDKKDFLVFGLCDDEIGYIIPENNYLLNEEHPYLDTVKDSTGENHYEETNSVGKDAAEIITDAARRLYSY